MANRLACDSMLAQTEGRPSTECRMPQVQKCAQAIAASMAQLPGVDVNDPQMQAAIAAAARQINGGGGGESGDGNSAAPGGGSGGDGAGGPTGGGGGTT